MRFNDIQSRCTAAVHFVLSQDFDFDLSPLEMSAMTGSLKNVETDKELFSVISKAMKFPDYFGENWDAFDECIADMEWMPSSGYVLVLHDADNGWKKNPYALGRLVNAWLSASEYWSSEKIPFHLVFIMLEEHQE